MSTSAFGQMEAVCPSNRRIWGQPRHAADRPPGPSPSSPQISYANGKRSSKCRPSWPPNRTCIRTTSAPAKAAGNSSAAKEDEWTTTGVWPPSRVRQARNTTLRCSDERPTSHISKAGNTSASARHRNSAGVLAELPPRMTTFTLSSPTTGWRKLPPPSGMRPRNQDPTRSAILHRAQARNSCTRRQLLPGAAAGKRIPGSERNLQ